ncbi:hypothetical protein GCM10012275_01640 [Longimycelium tulufanense]|uniref:Dentin sialophosphoprotein n=1 Tax=Longimycelium tulufanense TaxID=907463 RepID=A0A8J3FS64_9PSEU|nr:IniB N-terminal domain-containing protein [Longimycelium tulufanense]GGM33898.1 hypothetical protein GCM10012275_01640 [Longimycelium tulufanense]
MGSSLLDFILNLLSNSSAQDEFRANPEKMLQDNGFGDLCAADVHDALPLVADQVQTMHNPAGIIDAPTLPTPPSPQPVGGESELAAAIKQIQYITQHYSYDSHDTNMDNSTHQNIWAGGDVHQTFDNDPVIASGPGAIAAGDDVNANSVSGHHNVVGDGNMVHNGDGPTNFGDGQANQVSGIKADDGSAVAVGGNATSSSTDNSIHVHAKDFGQGSVGNTTTGSYNATDSNNTTTSASYNTTTTSDSHDTSSSTTTTTSGPAPGGTTSDSTSETTTSVTADNDSPTVSTGDDSPVSSSANTNSQNTTTTGEDNHVPTVDSNNQDNSTRTEIQDSYNDIKQTGLVNVGDDVVGVEDNLNENQLLSDNNLLSGSNILDDPLNQNVVDVL